MALAGCSAYDPDLLAHPARPTSKAAGGRTGTGGKTPDASPLDDTDGSAPVDSETDSGGPDEFPRSDAGSTSQTRCGDGKVSDSESCDIAIEMGQPGACPSEDDCAAQGTLCSPRAINNKDTCQAECFELPANCRGGDHCCPTSCTPDNDSDCSTSCHDGVVQADKGETCEPESKTAPCKTAADCDDKDACTTDTLTGSPDNCNVDCLHTKITKLHDGDGCCPEGGNNNTDKDCAAQCGNGVRESGEACDGGDGCSADCKMSATAPASDSPSCVDTECSNICFPVGILPCCNPLGVCGCTWAPGAYCL